MIAAVIACAVAVALVTIVVGSNVGGRAQALERRLSRLEAKLDEVAQRAGVRFDDEAWQRGEIARLVAAGRKIEAIRVYREQHPDVGLREAKQHIDSLVERPNN